MLSAALLGLCVLGAEPPSAELTDLEDSGWVAAKTRVHVSLGGGIVDAVPGDRPGGVLFSLGKPLWLGDRHDHYQWVFDSVVLGGYAPSVMRGVVVLSPSFGINLYFGSLLGFEARVGIGGAATAATSIDLGPAEELELVVVLRPFADDRTRLKLGLQGAAMFPVVPRAQPGLLLLTDGLALSFETSL